MTVEISLLISVFSFLFALYTGSKNIKKNDKQEIKNETSETITIMCKLEGISNGISDIKKELTNVKTDIKEDREKIIRLDESVKQSHKRIDDLEHRMEQYHVNQ